MDGGRLRRRQVGRVETHDDVQRCLLRVLHVDCFSFFIMGTAGRELDLSIMRRRILCCQFVRTNVIVFVFLS